MTDRRTLTAALLRVCPPWLRRTVGARVMQALVDPADAAVDGLDEAARLRFPTGTGDPDALAMIGRERRIRRGPGEDAATYAARLLPWWEAHRRRGGPYELLTQLHAFFRASHPGLQIDCVAQSGLRHIVDGDGVIERDAISWGGDGSGEWAHVWLFFHLGDLPVATATLITEAGETLVTSDGNSLIAVTDLSSVGTISDEAAELYRAIPREWSAAHIPYVTIVLLHGSARLWGYPVPVPTWGAWGTWQSVDPVVLIAE